MKSVVKNIIIIVEFLFILFLSGAVLLLWKKEPEAVQTGGNVTDKGNKSTAVDADAIKDRVTKNYYQLSGKKLLLSDSTFGEIWIPVLENVQSYSANKNIEQLKNRNGRKYYVENSEVTSYAGIDVSVHNNDIDWKKVKDSGIDFAIIRQGFRAYGTGKLQIDENFVTNVKGARNEGINVGAYFFSQATTVDEAIEEAQLLIDNISGLDINYPIVYDWEIIYDDTARTDNVPVDVLTDCCIAFCEAIKDAGYTPMIYQNKRTTLFKLDLERLKDYDFWLAEYSTEPTYYYDFSMWQYSCKGSVPGIKGDVDLNISFKDYAS